MATVMGSLCKAATRKQDEPLNILTFPTHERYEVGLAQTGHNFYAWRCPEVKDWNTKYAPVPQNYILLNPKLGENQIPDDIDFDVILSQNKFGQFSIARQLAHKLHLPLISLEHTLPMPDWGDKLSQLKDMRGHINVFISEYSRDKWGWGKEEAEVIHHGIDIDTFTPGLYQPKQLHVLSVVNDFANRDWCCGFRLWQVVTGGLPVKLLGDNPGIGRPAKDINELVSAYRQCRVFLNTSLISPVPTALLEAMACGCAVVSTDTCMIPEIIKDGVNGFICNNERQMRNRIELLLEDEELGRKLGDAARGTIELRFPLSAFIRNWQHTFLHAANTIFTGDFNASKPVNG